MNGTRNMAGIVFAVVSKDFDGTAARSNPIDAVQFTRDNGLSGNVYNDYDFGGYLIFSRIPTFIDGRAELYGRKFFNEYYSAAWQLSGGDLFKLLDEHKVTWTLMRPQSGGAVALDLSPGWACVFEGKVGVLHVRVGSPDAARALKSAKRQPCERAQVK